jgi:hypothetical protein
MIICCSSGRFFTATVIPPSLPFLLCLGACCPCGMDLLQVSSVTGLSDTLTRLETHSPHRPSLALL